MEFYSAEKKSEMMKFVRNLLGMESSVLNNVNQTHKEKKNLHILTRTWILLCNAFICLSILGFTNKYKYV